MTQMPEKNHFSPHAMHKQRLQTAVSIDGFTQKASNCFAHLTPEIVSACGMVRMRNNYMRAYTIHFKSLGNPVHIV